MLSAGELSNDRVRFIKFLLVGCSNFIISFGVFYFFYEHWRIGNMVLDKLGILGGEIKHILGVWGVKSVDGTIASVSGYLCGIVNSFFWNRGWTFKSDSKVVGQFPRFLLLNMLCLVLSAMSIFIFVDTMHFPYKQAWFVTMSFVTILNFFGNKWWVFNKKSYSKASLK